MNASSASPGPRRDVDVDEVGGRPAAAMTAATSAARDAGHRVSLARPPMTAWAAASRAIGMRNGEQLT